MKHRNIQLAIGLASLACASSALSHSHTLEPITVTTGTKTPRLLEEAPVRTMVVSKKEVEKIHAQNLAEALRYVPGVQLKPIHGKTGQAVWMQGYDGDRVLILVDGNPVVPTSGTAVDVTQIAIGDISHIEIVKGSVSALYGASAMGGVINVITQDPEHKLATKLDLSIGNWGDQSEKHNPSAKEHAIVGFSGKGDKWSGQFMGDFVLSDGYKATEFGNATQGWHGHKNTVSGKLKYQLDKNTTLSVMPRFFDEDAAYYVDDFAPGLGWKTKLYRDKSQRQHLSAVIESQKGESSWKLRGMFEDYKNDSFKKNFRDLNTYYSELAFQMNHPINEDHLLTFGIESDNGGMDANNYSTSTTEVDNEKKRTAEFYIQDSWFVTENWEVLPGVRVDYDTRDDTHISPMINAMYSRTDWLPGRVNFRMGLGNGYRTPSLKELYYRFDHSQIGYMVVGNPNLKPESSWSLQTGFEWAFEDGGSFEMSAYHNDIDNLIETAFDPNQVGDNNSKIYNYQNISKAMTQGIEVVFRKSISNSLRFDASYSYLDSIDKVTNKVLPNRSEHEVKLGVDYSLTPSTLFTLKMNYESDHYIDVDNANKSPGFSTFDFKFNQNFGDDWTLYAGINNMLAEQREFNGKDFRPEEGRFFYLGMRWDYKEL